MYENHNFKDPVDETQDDSYMGPERRYKQRRKAKDRREEVRFEVGKDNRRETAGRRKEDKAAFHRQKFTI